MIQVISENSWFQKTEKGMWFIAGLIFFLGYGLSDEFGKSLSQIFIDPDFFNLQWFVFAGLGIFTAVTAGLYFIFKPKTAKGRVFLLLFFTSISIIFIIFSVMLAGILLDLHKMNNGQTEYFNGTRTDTENILDQWALDLYPHIENYFPSEGFTKD